MTPEDRIREALGLIDNGVRLEIIRGSAFAQALRDVVEKIDDMEARVARARLGPQVLLEEGTDE